MPSNILIVEDDPAQLAVLGILLRTQLSATVETATSGQQALERLEDKARPLPDLVLLDLRMPGVDGFSLLRHLKPLLPGLPVIILTAYGDTPSAVQAMKLGAVDFLQKQEPKERILTAIRNALETACLRRELGRRGDGEAGGFGAILGRSPALEGALSLARKAAHSDATVLLRGESGVGKEVFARAIHAEGPRGAKPFVAVNCGAIPENLIESTLFGHEKGSFTGAIAASPGKFRAAEGGTIFLDEVSELPLLAQTKLLRVLQEREVEPVGAKASVKVDVRVIAATNRDLKEEVQHKRFREDLFYRIAVFPLTVPSLKERGAEDILLLARHFLKRSSAEEHATAVGFTPAAESLLKAYHWPGNVRQLENSLRRAVLLSDDTVLDTDDFPALLYGPGTAAPILPPPVKSRVALTKGDGHFRHLAEIEAEILRAALQHYGWHISEAARQLGIGRSTLYRRIEALGLDKERQPGTKERPASHGARPDASSFM